MKKYIIELEDVPFNRHGNYADDGTELYRVKGFNSLVFDKTGLDKLTPYTEPDTEEAYEQGFAAGQEAAKESYHDGYKTGRQDEKDDMAEILDGVYQRGLCDAWEAARKINCCIKDGGFCIKESQNIFGTPDNESIMCDYSAAEAIEKIRQYEQEKEEQIIKGDIVLIKSISEVKILVTYADEEYVSGIALTEVDGKCEIGDKYTNIRISNVEKTGKHYDIVSILQKMGEE